MPEPALCPAAEAGALDEALAAYFPPLLRERIARERPVFGQPFASEFEGAVLFTDISGFTGLTERLDASGPDGVERLSAQLNSYFSGLIGLVEKHGGLVAKSAGDALIAVWTADGRTLAEAVAAASRCAREVVAASDGGGGGAGEKLSVKASVGAGRIVHAILGGAGARWVSMIGGEAVGQARVAMAKCNAGAVTFGMKVIADEGNAVATGDGWIERKAEVAWPEGGWLRAHTPAAVLDRIVADHIGWIAEFRRVSVLFVHVAEAALERESDLDAVQHAFAAIQGEIERWGGVIEHTGEDHSGLVVLAAFGLPGATYDDDATRAARAALALSGVLGASVGVSTGRVFCGSIGSRKVRAYSMVGDAVNRGERLMRLAGGKVVCDEATRCAASRHLQFGFLRHEILRGRLGAEGIYRPTERRAIVPLVTVIGRDPEREHLRKRVATLASGGQGGVVIVEGEAGIGKSTLLAGLRAALLEAGISLFQGGADAIDSASTYHAWQPVFTKMLGLDPDLDAAARAIVLTEVIAGWVEDAGLVPLLNPIFGTHLPENEITREMAAQPRAEAVTRLLLRLVERAAAASPMAVAIEDCHWLDSASLALALALARAVPRVLLVLVTRPLGTDAPGAWAALREAAGNDHLRLGPLGPEDGATLAARRLGVSELDPPLARLIAERSGGNPFFCEEICHTLRDGAYLLFEEGRCRLVPENATPTALHLPATVQGVVSARIDRLSARERLAMKVASVNGRLFSLRMLDSVHPVASDRPHLRDCLHRLVALDFAMPIGVGEEDAFEFKHSIVQEVAYGQLTFSQRQDLHRRLAEWMEREQPSDLAQLARHWTEAAVPARAIHFLDRAGDEAIRRFANREAEGFLTRALAMADTGGAPVEPLARGRWHRQLGEAQFHLGRLAECREHLAESMRVLGWPLPGRARLPTLALPAAITRQFVRRVWPRRPRPCEPARQEHLLEALHGYQLLGEAAYFTNDLVTCGICIFHGTNLAESLGPSPAQARLYCAVMALTGMVSRRVGEAYLRLATRAVDACEHPPTRAYADLIIGIYLGGFGECARLHRHLTRACEIFRRYGDGRRLEESLVNFIYPLVHCGDYAACARPLEEMRLSAESRDDTQSRGWVRIIRAQLLLPVEGPQAALDALGADCETGVDALTSTAMHATAAIAWWRLGEAERARHHALLALDRNERQPPRCYVMLLYTDYVAEVFLGLFGRASVGTDRRREEGALARRACFALRRFARLFPVARARAALCDGLWHSIRGRRAAARRHWNRALETARHFATQPEQARALGLLSESAGDAHFSAAAAIYERIGAHAELDALRSGAHACRVGETLLEVL